MTIKEKLGSVLSSTLKYALAVFVVMGGFFILGHQAHASCTVTYTATVNQGASSNGGCSLSNGFQVSNSGYNNGQAMNWSSYVSSGSPNGWMSLSKTSGGPLGSGGTDQVYINLNTSTVGNYSVTYTIQGTSASDGSTAGYSPQTITINLNVTIPAPCYVNVATTYNGVANSMPPGGYNYHLSGNDPYRTNNYNGSAPANPSIQVTPGTTWSLSASSVQGWITDTISPSSLTCGSAGATATFTINFQDNLCQIYLTSTYNGAAATAPSGGFSYFLSGNDPYLPSSYSGSAPPYPGGRGVTAGTNWNISVSGFSSNVSYTVSPGTSQTCVSRNSSITFTVNFTDNPPSPISSGPTVSNTANGCGTVTLNWGAPSGGSPFTSYYIYRSTNSSSPYDSGNPWIDTGNTNTSFSYNASTTTAYYYWVAAHSSATGSTSTLSNPSALVEAAVCQADFSNSNKVIYSVNGTAYPFSAPANCGGTASGTLPRSYKGGDTVTWYINLCNYGTIDSTSVTLNDTMTNVTPSGASPYAISINGGGFNAINPTSASCSGNTCTASFSLAGIKVSKNSVLRITTTLNQTNVQSISRFRNQASFIFSTSMAPNNLGCVGQGETSFNYACTVSDPGWIPYHGSPAASQQEVSP